jgi:hypothetical protein
MLMSVKWGLGWWKLSEGVREYGSTGVREYEAPTPQHPNTPTPQHPLPAFLIKLLTQSHRIMNGNFFLLDRNYLIILIA